MRMLSSMLYDKVIDLEFYNDDNLLMQTVKTPRYGLKPKIELEWSRVPGNFCYNIILKVTNLYTQWELYKFASVVITVGYSSNNQMQLVKLNCQIFDSFTPMPGPDGYTIFECIVAKADTNVYTKQPYNIFYYRLDTQVHEVLSECASKMGLEFPVSYLSVRLLSMSWNDKEFVRRFDEGYSLLSYLQLRLSELARLIGHDVTMIVWDTKVIFAETDEEGNPVTTTTNFDTVPILNQLNSATWTAGTLSVVAPFNPDVTPGSIFYCNPATYTGGKALNRDIVKKGKYKDEYNLYYVITQHVSFATDSTTNQMNLLAVPFSNSLANTDAALKQARNLDEEAKKMAQEAQQIKAIIKEDIDIIFGAGESSKPKDFWTEAMTGSNTEYCIQPGDTLSKIGEKYYATKFHGIGSNSVEYNLSGWYAGYPLIAHATYLRYSQDTKANARFKIDPENPDKLTVGNYLVIPTISDWKDAQGNTSYANQCEAYANYYLSDSEKSEWGKANAIIADIVKEGKIL